MTLIHLRDWLNEGAVVMVPRYWLLILGYLVLVATVVLAKGLAQ